MQTLSWFNSGQVRLFVTNVIGANGIYYRDVSTVVNFDFPGTGADYLRRAEKIGVKNGLGILHCE